MIFLVFLEIFQVLLETRMNSSRLHLQLQRNKGPSHLVVGLSNLRRHDFRNRTLDVQKLHSEKLIR